MLTTSRGNETIVIGQAASPLDKLASVLIVDEAKVVRTFVERMLTSLGIPEIGQAVNAANAFQLLHERHFDLVLLDVERERTSGLELLHAMRSRPSTRSIPVVMMTTSRKVEYIMSVKTKADAYLLKRSIWTGSGQKCWRHCRGGPKLRAAEARNR